MEYKKSYRGLILWLLGYMAVSFSPILLPKGDGELMTRLILAVTGVAIVGLMVIILRTESVYWINGVTFEQAREAGSERRRAFAAAHVKPFARFGVGYLLFSAIMHACGASIWIDIAVFCVGLIVAAFSTIHVRL